MDSIFYPGLGTSIQVYFSVQLCMDTISGGGTKVSMAHCLGPSVLVFKVSGGE